MDICKIPHQKLNFAIDDCAVLGTMIKLYALSCVINSFQHCSMKWYKLEILWSLII